MTELIRQYLFIIDYTIFYLTHLPTTIQITKAIKFATIILAPAGVDQTKEEIIPTIKHTKEIITAQIITLKKLLKIRIAESAGNTIKLEIIIAPIKRIPITIVNAVRTAIKPLYKFAFIPDAVAKFSSNVTRNILL